MKASFADVLLRIPGPVSERWPEGQRFVRAFSYGSMSVELYAPSGHDPQTPHDQDELYMVVKGTSEFVLEGERMSVAAGDCVFVPSGAVHRFELFRT